MSEQHSVEDIVDFNEVPDGFRIKFKSGKDWLVYIENAFTERAIVKAIEVT